MANPEAQRLSRGGDIRFSGAAGGRRGVETNVGGEKTVVTENEFATVKNGRISPKEKLYAAPKLIAPPALEQILASFNGSADVTFRWEKIDGGAGSYHLQVSNSPFFVADGIVKETDNLFAPSLLLANVAPGTYYWRIRATAASGQTTEWSEPWRFTILKREDSAGLGADGWQVENLGSRVFRVSGKTRPGAVVRILGRETFATGDGGFVLQVASNAPDITVEISDERGNRTSYVLALDTARVLRQY